MNLMICCVSVRGGWNMKYYWIEVRDVVCLAVKLLFFLVTCLFRANIGMSWRPNPYLEIGRERQILLNT